MFVNANEWLHMPIDAYKCLLMLIDANACLKCQWMPKMPMNAYTCHAN